MKFSQRTRGLIGAIAVAMALALPASVIVTSSADARIGGGSSSGSRGSQELLGAASDLDRARRGAAVQPHHEPAGQPRHGRAPAAGAAAKGGFFNRPGMGMLGGLAAGFLGAGLLGMLFGGGLFSGLGGLSSIIGLLIQVVLIVVVVRLAMSWWQRRNANANAAAYAGPASGPEIGPGPQAVNRNAASGFGFGSTAAPLEILPADYEAFERLLTEIQATWSNGDIGHLHMLATPEMVSYFTSDLEANKARGVVNKVSNVKLLQGDLAEAWREGETDFATVAMRFSLVDKTLDATGKLVDGSDQPIEVTEVWTFARRRGSDWELSAIQQV